MANTFLTPDVIARAALATLYENTVAAQLVHRDYSSEFVAKVGDTITIRKPAVFEAEEFNPSTGINVQEATEGSVAVTLNHHADVSFEVTSRQLSLEIEDFRAQLLDPALEAVSQKIDRDVLAFRNDLTNEVGTETGSEWDKPEALIEAGVILDIANVPLNERRVIVGPRTKGKWLSNDILKRADQSGTTSGLRQASFGGDLFGFTGYMSQNIGQPKAPALQQEGDPTTEVSVAFHRTAVALVTRQLELPRGASNAAIEGYKGFGIRVVIDFHHHRLVQQHRHLLGQQAVGFDGHEHLGGLDADLEVLEVQAVEVLDAARAVLIKGADAAGS